MWVPVQPFTLLGKQCWSHMPFLCLSFLILKMGTTVLPEVALVIKSFKLENNLEQYLKVKVKSLSHVWLCDPMDCSPLGSFIHGIFQAGILEWVAIYLVHSKFFNVSVLLLQWCLTLCHPMDDSPQGFSVHGIFQARILEWVAISSSKGGGIPRDWTHVCYISCIGRRVL